MKAVLLLSAFYTKADADHRMGTAHICVYMALLHEYIMNRYQNPLFLKRNTIMSRAKIRSRTTYDQCLHDLHRYGYIDYKPSYDYGGSLVNMIPLY